MYSCVPGGASSRTVVTTQQNELKLELQESSREGIKSNLLPEKIKETTLLRKIAKKKQKAR